MLLKANYFNYDTNLINHINKYITPLNLEGVIIWMNVHLDKCKMLRTPIVEYHCLNLFEKNR